jgi:2-(1,2-epoxy-1,2-dihydrophenyl)acetyl-CoA isomerase
MSQDIVVEKKGRVLVITLNRPEVLNAFRMSMVTELTLALQEADADDGVGCIGFFDNLREITEDRVSDQPILGLPRIMFDLKKPLIAAINGLAVGMGCTMILPCDIRIASDRARFGYVFSRVGLVPEFGSSFLLPRIVGLGNAIELCLTGRLLDVQEALAMGLVNKVVPHEGLMDATLAIATTLANGPTRILGLVKKVLHQGLMLDLEQAEGGEAEAFAWCLRSPEHVEGVRAFLEKREARFW